MPTVIDSLVVTLGLDASKFTAAQKQAVSSLKQFEEAANKHGKGAQKGIDDLVGSFKELQGRLLAIGALIAAGLGFNRLVQDVTKANTELGQLSKTLNISAENLSAWDHVGRTVGAATGEMSQGIKKFNDELSKMRAGMDSDLMAWMGTVGIDVRNMRTGEDVARGLNRYYNQQAAKGPMQGRDAAFQIQNFSGASQSQLNALMLPPAELEKRLAFGKKFAPTQEDIDRFTKLTQAWGDLMTILDKLTRDALTPFIDALTIVLKKITDWLIWWAGGERFGAVEAGQAGGQGMEGGGNYPGQANPGSIFSRGATRLRNWLGMGGPADTGSGAANDNAPVTLPTEGGSAFLSQGRRAFAQQLSDPAVLARVKGMAVLEGAKDPTPVIESLANRFGYVNEERTKRGLPPLTVDQMLDSGFYAPINKGRLPGALLQLRNDKALSSRMNAAVDRVLAGSNTIKGFTDQGLPTDPNGWRQPQIKNREGNVFTDWNGGPGGAQASAAYRQRLMEGVAAEQKAATQAGSKPPLAVMTPGLTGAQKTFELWQGLGGARGAPFRGGDTNSNTNNSNTTTNIHSMNVTVPHGADPSAYADGISRRLADYDNIQNANTGMV